MPASPTAPAGSPERPGMPRTGVVVVAAGSGTRVGPGANKVLRPLLGSPVLAWSLRTVCSLAYVERLVVVVRAQDLPEIEALLVDLLPEDREAVVVVGGDTRHASEWRGLQALRGPVVAGELDVLVVHDAARPLAEPALFDATVQAARTHGGALPVRPQPGLLSGDGARHLGHIVGLVGVQTPQAFRARPLLDAYARAEADGFAGTDTAGTVAAYTDLTVLGVPAPATNLKVTFAEDLALAERLLTGP